MNKESKLLVVLFSDPNFLALNILEILLSKNCEVRIVSENKKTWESRTSNLSQRLRFSVIGVEEYKKLNNFSYAVFIGGFIKKELAYSDFKKFIANRYFGNAKTLAIFPFESFSLKTSSKIAISGNAGIIYLGDLLGPRIDLESNLLLPSLINEMVSRRKITLGLGEVFYPIFIADAAKTIVKWLLSFGPYGKDIFLLGHQVSSGDFWKENLKSFPDLKILYDTDKETRFIPKGYDKQYLNSNLNICLNEMYKWIIEEKTRAKVAPLKTPVVKKQKIKKPPRFKYVRSFILILLILIMLPVITTLLSSGFLYLSYRQFLSDDINTGQKSAYVAKTLFVIGKSESDAISIVPGVGRLFQETSYISESGETLCDMAINAIPLMDTSKELLGNVLGTGIYDSKVPADQIKSSLDYIYRSLSVFQIVTANKANSGLLSAKQVLQLVDFDKLKSLAQGGGYIAKFLPSILGASGDKNYLILFENNMELRPTGGFIGSYGIANFGGGKLNGLTINDIYSADGQLKGHVEPPAPIKNYLNEANWFFRDSNWDPDFPTSAERAEWFLGKEMNQDVDGVIAMDLEPIKSILRYTGPIFLPDYNLTITSDNLYEKTQEEAQADTFAGSRQKASFLTALSRNLLNEIPKMNSKDRILVMKAFYESLNGRHIQIYLHDQNPAVAINSLAWDGKIQSYSCGDACYSDFFGDVEANVGDNKSNYFVNRKLDFNVKVGSNSISRNLTISLTNTANPSLGVSGIYKTYLRLMIPSDSTVAAVKVVEGPSESIVPSGVTHEKGRQEIGIYVEITPGQTKRIEFAWQNDVSGAPTIKSYGLFVRKQAGVGNDPLSVAFNTQGSIVSQPVFSLTKQGIYTYNTNLVQDFFARMSWK